MVSLLPIRTKLANCRTWEAVLVHSCSRQTRKDTGVGSSVFLFPMSKCLIFRQQGKRRFFSEIIALKLNTLPMIDPPSFRNSKDCRVLSNNYFGGRQAGPCVSRFQKANCVLRRDWSEASGVLPA